MSDKKLTRWKVGLKKCVSLSCHTEVKNKILLILIHISLFLSLFLFQIAMSSGLSPAIVTLGGKPAVGGQVNFYLCIFCFLYPNFLHA